jgi:hypothetical protein
MSYVLATPVLAFFLASAVVAFARKSFAAGAQTAVWCVVVTGLAMFTAWVLESLRWYRIHHSMLLDAASGPVGQNLHDAVFWLGIVLPVWSLPFGILGAALGSRIGRWLDWLRSCNTPV